MMKLLSTFLVLLFAMSAVAQDTVIEEIVVRINNSIITRSDLQRARQQMESEAQQAGAEAGSIEDREKDLLRDLIDQQLLVQKAGDLGISGDTELIKRLDEIRRSMNLDSMEALERVATQQGVSYEDFRQNLRNSILTQATIGREVGSRIRITQEEERRLYEENKDKLEQPERIRLSEILFSTEKAASQSGAQPDSDAVKLAVKQKAEAAMAAIQGGTPFEEVARKYSDGTSAEQGGDLGYFERGSLAAELEAKTFDQMEPGETSEIIATRQGLIILKVTEHTEGGIPPFSEVESRIQEMLYLQKLQPALREYLTKLREEAFIDIKPGFQDSGASPNQTQPVMASNTPSDDDDEDSEKKRKRFLIF